MTPFDTTLTITGRPRSPRQLLADQEYDGHTSVHDDAVAGSLGLTGAPIEGPTHFSQFEPIAFALWGRRWYETGCLSAHFRTMVVEGDEVVPRAEVVPGATTARIDADKVGDGLPVLTGTMSVGASATSELDERLARAVATDPGDLFVVDRVVVGERSGPAESSVDLETPNGSLYPFSLQRKLDVITESNPWFSSADNPWDRPVLPFEMVSVLGHKTGSELPVRGPAVGLFLDLEVRLVDGPLFVGQTYRLEREVVALAQTRKVESHWVRTTISDPSTDRVIATMLLHSGVFKASYAGYPTDRL